MNIQDIRLLYAYNYWATRQILAASAQVSQEQFQAPGVYGYGSIQNILIHTLDAENGWRMRCQHNRITPEITEANVPTYTDLVQRWHDEETEMWSYLGGLQDESLSSIIRYTTDQGEHRERVLWHCLVHVVNHGTQHRSEAAALLTGYDHSPGDLDFTVFLNRQGSA